MWKEKVNLPKLVTLPGLRQSVVFRVRPSSGAIDERLVVDVWGRYNKMRVPERRIAADTLDGLIVKVKEFEKNITKYAVSTSAI
jgi:hypothetical protein